MWLNVLLLSIIIAGVLFVFVLAKQRRRCLIHLFKEASGLAAGDTSSFSKSSAFPAEYRPLVQEMNKVSALLKTFAENSQVTAGQVAAAVEQMSVTTDHTKQLAQDFSRVETVAQSLAGISAELKQEARDNEQAVASCQEALSAARQAMDMIKADSDTIGGQVASLKIAVQKVDQIIGIIGEISDRTRLLAFNAAIEAARVGEYGRGFAVVAQEVKALSEGTTHAVRDTEGILLSLGQEVGKVVEIVNAGRLNIEAGVTHTYIVEEGLAGISTAVNDMAGKIEASNKEITEYLSQVNTAAASQKNSLEEITEVGELLKKAAHMLEKNSSKVRLSGEGAASSSKLAPLVERLKNILLDTAAKSKVLSMNVEQHREVLLGVLRKHVELEAVWSNRTDGSFILSEPPAGLANARIRQWWQRAMAGDNYVSEVYVSAITRKPCLTLSVPIRAEDGVITGVLGVDVRLDSALMN